MRPVPPDGVMEPLLDSTGIVALAEIGDKTQLLALILAARYRKPAAIAFGILFATLINHGLAAWLGALAASSLGPDMLRWILGIGFLVMAAWCLVPDKVDEGPGATARTGAFLSTLVSSFL